MAETPAPKATPREQVIARFPAFVGLFGTDQERAALVAEFGQDLVDLLLDVVNNPKNYDFTTAEGQRAFDAKVSGTKYVLNTIESQRKFELLAAPERENKIKLRVEQLAEQYGELGLNQTQLRDIAIKAEKGGLTAGSISERHLVYSSTSQMGKTGIGMVSSTSDADKIRKIARDYGYRPVDLDEKIQQILTGTPNKEGVVLTEEAFIKQAKSQAMGMYPHLKMQLDNGSTLSDIFGSYKSLAANILETTEDSIDMSSPLYAAALGTPETGVMSLSNWETMIKSDRRYGYQYTKQANKDATDLGLLIARAFGEVQ